jgi:drug/metabolite transporter (DMT)-like permease
VFEVIGASPPPTSTSAILTRGVATTLHGATSGDPHRGLAPYRADEGPTDRSVFEPAPYFGSRGVPSSNLGSPTIRLLRAECGSASSSLLGDLLVLPGSLAAAGYSVAARTFADRAPALSVTAYQFLAPAIFVSPLTVAEVAGGHSHLAAAPADQLIAAVATGLLGSVIAFLLFNVAIARTSASRAAIILNLIPVFGTIGAIVLLAKRPTRLQLVGGTTILVGLLVLDDDETKPQTSDVRATRAA